jgi:hypothetical protein
MTISQVHQSSVLTTFSLKIACNIMLHFLHCISVVSLQTFCMHSSLSSILKTRHSHNLVSVMSYCNTDFIILIFE